MNLEELQEMSAKDLKIDDTQLDIESLKTPELYGKYLKIFMRWNLLLKQVESKHRILYRQKWEYYGGKADAKVYASKPFDLKVLKSDLAMYITSDEDIIELMNKIGYLEIVIKYIDGVIKSIDNRGWDIKNAIEWRKFEAGMM